MCRQRPLNYLMNTNSFCFSVHSKDFILNLVVMEDGVGKGVLSWNCAGPQLLHEKHLIGQRGNDSCRKESKITEEPPKHTRNSGFG